jgi:hypothetical protein
MSDEDGSRAEQSDQISKPFLEADEAAVKGGIKKKQVSQQKYEQRTRVLRKWSCRGASKDERG